MKNQSLNKLKGKCFRDIQLTDYPPAVGDSNVIIHFIPRCATVSFRVPGKFPYSSITTLFTRSIPKITVPENQALESWLSLSLTYELMQL